MNNVTGNKKIRTKLNDSDRKVLNICGSNYVENSSVFPQNSNPVLNESISNNQINSKSRLSKNKMQSDFYQY